ncbi:hypothetical protein Tco_0373090 [Tanacetum coccineum]
MVVVMEPTMIQDVILKVGVLTDEAIRNGSIKKNPKKRGNGGEPSKDRNMRDDNKRTRIGNAFAKDCRVMPRNVNPVNARNLVARTCYECGSSDYISSACPRMNQGHGPGETIRTKSWLLMRVRVVGTKGIR